MKHRVVVVVKGEAPVKRGLRVGTRRSPLALTQTRWVVQRLSEVAPDVAVTIVPLQTEGDIDRTTPLPQMGGRGVFVTRVEEALRNGEVDFAVHSLKDLPTQPAEGLIVAAVPQREDPRDALISARGWTLEQLPEGAVVGTGSLRRQAQLALVRPDLRFEGIRGNIDTRRQKALSGECDATLLAMAGLRRAGLTQHATPVSTEVILPAAGQGALALQCRIDDTECIELLRRLDDPVSHAAVGAERRLLQLLRGGCHAPVGTFCHQQNDAWIFEACVAHPTGTEHARIALRGDDPMSLAEEAYATLQKDPVVQRVIVQQRDEQR